jgi:hypothetical protein
LKANPTVTCAESLSGQVIQPVNGQCPTTHHFEPRVGCIKRMGTCPANYDLVNGLCVKPCPANSVRISRMIELENNGVISRHTIPVCQISSTIL